MNTEALAGNGSRGDPSPSLTDAGAVLANWGEIRGSNPSYEGHYLACCRYTNPTARCEWGIQSVMSTTLPHLQQ